MIFEQPDEEDRESLPIEKRNRDRMKPTIAKDEIVQIDHMYTLKAIKNHVKPPEQIKLVLDHIEQLKRKKELLATRKPPKHKHSRSQAEELINPIVKQTWAPYQVPDIEIVPPVAMIDHVTQWRRIRMNENACVLINPKTDSSD